MTKKVQFRTLPVFGADQRSVAEVVNGAMNGKTNNTGSFELASGGASSTVIYDDRIGYDSVILIMATSISSSTKYFPYGAFQDGTTQTIASTTTAYPMLFNTVDYSEGVNIVSNSRIQVDYSGLYNIQFSSQFANSDSQIQDISVWFDKNGAILPGTNGEFTISERHGSIDGGLIAGFNVFIPLQKNDYIEIMWRASNIGVSMKYLPAQTSPTRPSTPSVIATVSHVSSNGYTVDTFSDPYISSQSQGSAVISHPANYASGKTYDYIVVG